jgi:hypothetical protein
VNHRIPTIEMPVTQASQREPVKRRSRNSRMAWTKAKNMQRSEL